jgi:site-specific DNA recombinase
MKFNVENGHRAGGRAPFGYRLEHTPTGAIRQGRAVVKSRLVLDPENAPKVKRYLKLRAEGRNRPDATAGSGMPRSSVTTLVGIERNALTYAGITVWNRRADRKTGQERYRPRSEWVLQRGTHDALITEAEAEKLMAHALPRPERRPRTASVSYLLTGVLYTPDGKAFHANGDGYYRANKGRRIPADALEEIVREQMNEEVDSHEFTARFIAELRREADRLDVDPEKIKREKKAVQTKLANLVRLAERAPDSESLAERLVALEAEMAELDAKLANAEQSAAMRRAIRATSAEEAAQMIAGWMAEDGASLDEQRAALAQLVERIEFNPATGEGRVLYRIAAWGDGRFRLSNKETGERGASPRGFEPRLPP